MDRYEELQRAEAIRNLKANLKGSQYKFTTRKFNAHLDCITEVSEFSSAYYCHSHKVAGIY